MEKLAYLLPVLGCAGMMGVMIWMMRGKHDVPAQPDPGTQEEIAVLRAQIAALRTEQAERTDDATRSALS